LVIGMPPHSLTCNIKEPNILANVNGHAPNR
jgi:hypothetical protein